MDGSAWDKSTILYPVISAYLHIPFCASSCDFFSFY